ncbi:hypothetical protein [Sphingobium sp. DC-2]|uniref:hypothetical protein n=1 Tax=Sphingobium sp. DC-2 TaxID=1303256 RepID=UPI00068F5A35|nr:hypothetical protein [Sphingobium sp. DC-2]
MNAADIGYRFRNGEVGNVADHPTAPFPAPILVNDRGEGFFPHAFCAGEVMLMPVCRGLAMGWAAAPEVGGALLSIFAGNPDAPTDESVATLLSRDGLRALIADLQSIDRQLGEG